MTTTTVTAGYDTNARSAAPNEEYAEAKQLHLQSAAAYAYCHLQSPAPRGSFVSSAKLRVYARGASSGARTLTAKRVTQGWVAKLLNWNNAPTVAASGATAAVNVLADGDVIEFDVTADVQAYVDGALQNLGWRIETNSGTLHKLYAFDYGEKAPRLVVTYTQPPAAPTGLRPSGGLVAVAQPDLAWKAPEQVSYEVQADPAANGTTPAYSSGVVATTENRHALAGTAFAQLPADASTTLWRVRVTDQNGRVSAWSDWATITRDGKGTLSVQLSALQYVNLFTRPQLVLAATTNFGHWAGTGGVASLTRVAGAGPSGQAIARLTWTTTGVGGGIQHAANEGNRLITTAGRKIGWRAKVRASKAVDIQPRMERWSAASGGAQLGATTTAGNVSLVANTWTTIQYEWTPSTSGEYVLGTAYQQTPFPLVAGDTLEMTDVEWYEGTDFPPSFFSGDTADTATVDYAWTGTANQSTSTQTRTDAVSDPTPTIVIGLTGETLASSELTITPTGQRDVVLYEALKPNGGTTYQVPEKGPLGRILITGTSYDLRVRAYDAKVRREGSTAAGDEPYVEVWKTFTLVASTGQAPTLTSALQVSTTPIVELTWTHTPTPNTFIVTRDGVEIATGLSPADLLVSANTYKWRDYTAKPGVAHAYRVRALNSGVMGAASSPQSLPAGGITPEGTFLIDPSTGNYFVLSNVDPSGWGQEEEGTTYWPKGARKGFRVTESLGGLAGTVDGFLRERDYATVAAMTTSFWRMKEEAPHSEDFRLVADEINIPVQAFDMKLAPHEESYQGYRRKRCRYGFYQTGEYEFSGRV